MLNFGILTVTKIVKIVWINHRVNSKVIINNVKLQQNHFIDFQITN